MIGFLNQKEFLFSLNFGISQGVIDMIDYKHLHSSNRVLLNDDDKPTAWQHFWLLVACMCCLVPFVYSLAVVVGGVL